MSKNPSFGTAMLLGAALMYFLDPAQGRRRRASVRDQALHARRVERAAAGKAGRDLSQRVRGLLKSLELPRRKDAVEDAKLEARVRARLGHLTSHPGAIHVEAHDGNILVRGPILAHEHDRVVRAIAAVPGVCDVVDRLLVREQAGSEPALQGNGRALVRRPEWAPAERAAVLGLGALLYGWGAIRRHGLSRRAARTLGGALTLRAVLGQPLRQAFGFGDTDGITVRKSIVVYAPIDEVFEMWTRFDRFPKFMDHVREVQLHEEDPRLSIWTVDGPAGMPFRFEAELTEYVAGRKVGWKTRPGQSIEHSGSVRFEPAEGGTRVHVQMRYVPPGGAAGHAVARILGWDPKRRMDDDLLRMKALLECGRTRAHRHRVAIDELD